MIYDECPNCNENSKLFFITYKSSLGDIETELVCKKCKFTTRDEYSNIMESKIEENPVIPNEYKQKIEEYIPQEPNLHEHQINKNLESITFIRPKEIKVDFSEVYGLDQHKALINMYLNQKHTDKMIHILLDSKPSLAKTFILEQIAKKSNIVQWCKFVNATMLTKTGFYEVIEAHKFGWLLIDEIDKLDKEHQPIFLDMLENNRVTVDKYSLHKDFEVDLQVIATSNDSSKLIPPLLSRFNILIINPYTKEETYMIGKKIMLNRYKINEDLAEYTIRKFIEIPNIYMRQIRDFCQLGLDSKEQVDQYFKNTKNILKLT